MLKITKDEIKVISDYIYKISGIALDASKAYLIETRLSSLAEGNDCRSYSELYYKAKTDPTRKIERKIIDAITTGETLFFRDQAPFEMLRYKILPDLIDKRKAQTSKNLPVTLRIWSAACSTGQEIYSIAITLKEILLDAAKYHIRLIGTDISDEAISRASYGSFNKFEIERGLPPDKLMKYFLSSGNVYRIRDEIRGMATFQKQNLLEPFNGLGKFDIIFCRNVAIYFTPEDRINLFNKIADVLEPDGYLIIGSTEFLSGVSERFVANRHLRSVFYELKRTGENR
jgi:chemotaxis protein methyltransferase CheR